MTTENINFAVTANQSSAGDYLPIDSDTLGGCTVTNGSAVAVEYSTGGSWTTIAAGASATISTGAIATTSLRFRKKTGDSYPVYISVSVAHPGIAIAQIATDLAGRQASSISSAVIPFGAAYDSQRKEARLALMDQIKAYADLKNPSATIAYTSAPAEIRVSFGAGEVWSLDQIRVLNESATAVSFQWEPAKAPADGSSIGAWPDGSIRSGSLWVIVSLTGGQTKRYTVEINAVEQGQTFSKNVTYTAVSGSIDELATTALRARFESGQGWMLRRYQDIANANFDLFSGSNGVYGKYQIAGAGKFSYTAGDISVLSHGLVGSSAFGYGVVFQEYQTVFSWNAESTTKYTVTYRVFADGSIAVTQYISVGATVASNARHMYLQAVVGSSGLTSTTDAAKYFMRFDYASSNFILVGTDCVRDYPLKSTEQHVAASINETTAISRVGWSGTTSIPAGAFFIQRAVITKYTSGDSANEFVRRLNPVVAHAICPKAKPDRFGLRDRALLLIDEAMPLLDASAWGGVASLLALSRGASPAAALATFNNWCALRGLTPSSSASWLALWNASTGFEYTGRNSQVLWWLREAFRVAGDSANQSLVESYIHAFADFCVSAETASGGAGTVKLRGSATGAAWNAATSAMAGLAASIAVTADAGRQTVYDRILAAYVAAAFAGQKWNYDSTAAVSTDPSFHYYAYQTFELARAKYLLPSTALPAGSLCSYIREVAQQEGAIDEWRANLQYRRGRESTQMYAAGCLVMLDRDYAAAYELTRHIAALDLRYASTGIDGFQASGSSDVSQETRVYAELILSGLL